MFGAFVASALSNRVVDLKCTFTTPLRDLIVSIEDHGSGHDRSCSEAGFFLLVVYNRSHPLREVLE